MIQTNNRIINRVTKRIFLITKSIPTHKIEKNSYGSPCLCISMCFDGSQKHKQKDVPIYRHLSSEIHVIFFKGRRQCFAHQYTYVMTYVLLL